MTRKAGVTIGTILAALCLVALGAGIALLVTAHGMPSHTDEQRASELTHSYDENYIEWAPEQRELVERQLISLRTSKWELYKGGLGMCLAAPILLIAMTRFRLWDIRNLQIATTPRTRLGFLGLASGAWLALLPAILLEIDSEYAQDDLRPTMDTGHGMFLVYGLPAFVLMWIAMLVVYRFVVLRSALLPANLWFWDGARPYRSMVWSVFYGLLSSVLIVLIAWAALAFSWSLPSLMVGLYVMLSTRAALLNRAGMPAR